METYPKMATKTETAEAVARLRDDWHLAPGTTVFTVLRHVSASGMIRDIDLYTFGPELDRDGAPVVSRLSYIAAKAIGANYNNKAEAIRVGGCGMDMGFHLVMNLGYALFPDGFGCIGERCPSNDHTNGDRDYTPHMNGAPNTFTAGYVGHWHKSGGYALRQRWI